MENWRDIPSYEGYYQCSDLGRVRSTDTKVRVKNYMRVRPGKLLTPHATNCGYMMVLLSRCNNRAFISVHRLVALTFIPNPDNKPCVNHKNGIKTDNSADNLEWTSISENLRHAYSIGLKCAKGDLNGRRKYKLKMHL